MSKEIAIYVNKVIDSSGTTLRFTLSTNKNSYPYWFTKLPPQIPDNDRVLLNDSFNGQVSQLLHDCNLAFDSHSLKIFYGQEYRTISKCTVKIGNDSATIYNIESVSHIIPMNEKEILHFMNLFNGFKNSRF